jgi:glycosyltransferase involved in cell wall biosynthesis
LSSKGINDPKGSWKIFIRYLLIFSKAVDYSFAEIRNLTRSTLRTVVLGSRQRIYTKSVQRLLPTKLNRILKRIGLKLLIASTNPQRLDLENPNLESTAIFSDLVFGDLVSIVLPVYNHGAHLPESINSVLNQDYENIQLVIVNDGSTDDTSEILKSYLANPRVTILHQENSKLPNALNSGFEITQGKLLTWTSADNIYEPGAVSALVSHMITNPTHALCYGNYSIIDESGRALRDSDFRVGNQSDSDSSHIILDPDRRLLQSMPDNFIGPLFMYRREVYERLGEYARVPGIEDYEYWLRISITFEVGHIRNTVPLYKYRVHKNTMSENQKELKIARNLQHLRDLFESVINGDLKNYNKALLESSCENVVLNSHLPSLYSAITKVAILVDDFGVGGLEKVIENLRKEWTEQNLEVCIFSQSKVRPEIIKSYPSIIIVECLASTTLIQELKRFQPDLINLHYVRMSLDEISSEIKVPLVQTIHNSYVWLCETDLKDMVHADHFIDHYIAVSENVANWAITVLGIKREKINVIRNGVPDFIENHEVEKFHDPYFLMLGSFTPHKRQEQLIQAFKYWKSNSENATHRLILSGSISDKDYYQEISDLVLSLGLSAEVELRGFQDMPYQLIRNSEACILPSMYEGGSIFLIEAALLGKPILATNVGDIDFLRGFTKVHSISNVPSDLTTITDADVHTFSRRPGEEFIGQLAEGFEIISQVLSDDTLIDLEVRRKTFSARRMATQYLALFHKLVVSHSFSKPDSPHSKRPKGTYA